MLSFGVINYLNRLNDIQIYDLVIMAQHELRKYPMKEYLQVKVQNLTDESKDIRKREQKAKWIARVQRDRLADGLDADPARFEKVNAGLHLHRIFDVRKEARSSHIAYGFLRGRKYHEIERLAYDQPNWERIERLIMKYSEEDSRITAQKFGEWKAEALGKVKARWISSQQPGAHRGRWTEWMHRGREVQSQQAVSAPELQAAE